MSNSMSGAGDLASAGLAMNTGGHDGIDAPWAVFEAVCTGPDGQEKWREKCRNIVTLEGKTLLMNVGFFTTAKPAWFLLLTSAGTKAVGDTLATHAGWTELTPYSGNRPAVAYTAATTVSVSGAQVTHTAVTFAITATATVAGCGVCTVATGTTGILYNAGDFSAARSVAAGDSLSVTTQLSLNP